MEKELQKKCVEYTRSLGFMIYSINPPNFKRMTYGTLKYLPDLLIVDFNAYFELKDAEYTKNHSDRQQKQKERRRELYLHGSRSYKVDTFNKFKTILEFLINEKEKKYSK